MINREQFIESIEALKLQNDKDLLFNLSITELLKCDHMPMYDNSALSVTIISLLGLEFDATEIERYCYELNFGRVLDADLKTIEDLWNHVNLL